MAHCCLFAVSAPVHVSSEELAQWHARNSVEDHGGHSGLDASSASPLNDHSEDSPLLLRGSLVLELLERGVGWFALVAQVQQIC